MTLPKGPARIPPRSNSSRGPADRLESFRIPDREPGPMPSPASTQGTLSDVNTKPTYLSREGLEKLRAADLNQMTPIAGLSLLAALQQRLKGK